MDGSFPEISLALAERRADGGPRTLTSAVFERLRADILSTRLTPGQKLHIAGLAKQFSVSLAAVREALSRLVADGLVQASDQRGFRVCPVSRADLEDVTQTRIEIEGLALRKAIEHGDAAWLTAVEVAHAALAAIPYRDPNNRSQHNERWIGAHRLFHRALVSACGSTWLLGFRDVLFEQSERYRRLSIQTEDGRRDVPAEHARIVAAVLRRDADAAVAAISQHFLLTMRHVRFVETEARVTEPSE
jgi:DNA-binding GntR family transcriptional regulator